MKNILAFVGFVTLLLSLLGALGIGDFVLFYGESARQYCTDRFAGV